MKIWCVMDFYIEEMIWVNDIEIKYKMKSYVGVWNCVDYCDIKVGDLVVMNIKENCS